MKLHLSKLKVGDTIVLRDKTSHVVVRVERSDTYKRHYVVETQTERVTTHNQPKSKAVCHDVDGSVSLSYFEDGDIVKIIKQGA